MPKVPIATPTKNANKQGSKPSNGKPPQSSPEVPASKASPTPTKESLKETPKGNPTKGNPKATKADKPESATTESPRRGRGKKKAPEIAREVIYDTVKIRLYGEDNPLTVALCKQLMGWRQESENIKFGADYLLTDERGQKIRCTNNVTNRPLYRPVVDTLLQEHLRRRWRFNGEPVIIGKTGLVLNGQHQMIALILAGQRWEDKHGQYAEYWKTEPTMQKLVVFGVDETDDVVNTMDTCKPRSLADVIYRSDYFKDLAKVDRMKISKITESAIKMFWHRTGAANAFAPRRTHAESLDLIARHPRLLQCVKHIAEEDGGERKVGKYLSTGYAAALLYLMGSARTERETDDKTGYSQTDHPNESQLNWDCWDKACEFFVLLAQDHVKISPIKEAIGAILERAGTATVAERLAILAKAWACYLDTDEIDPTDIELEYVTNDSGERVLGECPTVGGIDLGNPQD